MLRLSFMTCLLGALLIPAPASADVEVGEKPSYTATTIEGDEITAAELRGKVVLVDFWATWCGPCEESLPFHSKLADRHGDELVVLAVSVDAKRDDVRAFLKEHDFSFRVVWHEKHPLARTFGPTTFPTSYLIGKQGVVRHVHVGFDDDVRKKTAAQIEALVTQ